MTTDASKPIPESAWLEALIRAFNDHDAPSIGVLMTDDVTYAYWSDRAWVTLHGRNAVVELLDSPTRQADASRCAT